MATMSPPSPPPTVLLTAIYPHPECCLDTEEYGTFVLQGCRFSNGGIRMVVGSLSTLQYNKISSDRLAQNSKCTKVGAFEWTRVALWSSSFILSKIPVAQTIKGILDLEQRLQDALDEEELMRTKRAGLDPLHAFLKSGRAVFGRLLEALATAKREQHNGLLAPPAGSVSRHGWTTTRLLELHDQLESVESNFLLDGVELSPDLSRLSLQKIDEAKRVHTMVLDLTKFRSTNHDISIQQWQVPEVDSTYIQEEKRARKTKLTAATAASPNLSELYDDFEDIVQRCQGVWNELDDLDANLWVLLQDAANKNRSNCQRRICLRAPREDQHQRKDDGDRDTLTEGKSNMEQPTTIVLSLAPVNPRQRPENIHILGGSLSSRTKRQAEFDAYQWYDDITVRENLEKCFGSGSLAKPKEDDDASISSMDKKNATCLKTDCGICSLACTSTTTGTAASSPCENPKCARPYHTACLFKWLSSKPTSRTSFDYVLGECPYCKDPIAAQQPEHDDHFV